MPEKICCRSCSFVDEVNNAINAVKCGKDAQWRGEGGVCPHKLDDSVNHPRHYTSGAVECIDAIESAVACLHGMEALLTGQIIKYVWRWKQKGGVEDLRKAEWYLKRLIITAKENTKSNRNNYEDDGK